MIACVGRANLNAGNLMSVVQFLIEYLCNGFAKCLVIPRLVYLTKLKLSSEVITEG